MKEGVLGGSISRLLHFPPFFGWNWNPVHLLIGFCLYVRTTGHGWSLDVKQADQSRDVLLF
jgi:hypothetical protein